MSAKDPDYVPEREVSLALSLSPSLPPPSLPSSLCFSLSFSLAHAPPSSCGPLQTSFLLPRLNFSRFLPRLCAVVVHSPVVVRPHGPVRKGPDGSRGFLSSRVTGLRYPVTVSTLPSSSRSRKEGPTNVADFSFPR
jgi:hypothetical protein